MHWLVLSHSEYLLCALCQVGTRKCRSRGQAVTKHTVGTSYSELWAQGVTEDSSSWKWPEEARIPGNFPCPLVTDLQDGEIKTRGQQRVAGPAWLAGPSAAWVQGLLLGVLLCVQCMLVCHGVWTSVAALKSLCCE